MLLLFLPALFLALLALFLGQVCHLLRVSSSGGALRRLPLLFFFLGLLFLFFPLFFLFRFFLFFTLPSAHGFFLPYAANADVKSSLITLSLIKASLKIPI